MNKIIIITIIAIFLVGCTKVDLNKNENGIIENVKEIGSKTKEGIDSVTQNKTENKSSIVTSITNSGTKYETPSSVENKIDKEITVESFGETY